MTAFYNYVLKNWENLKMVCVMKIFCENCQNSIGQVPDGKIPNNKIVMAKCPHCRKQIKIQKSIPGAHAATLPNHSVSLLPEPPPLPVAKAMIGGNSRPSNPQPHLAGPDTNVPQNPHTLSKQLEDPGRGEGMVYFKHYFWQSNFVIPCF